MRITKKQYIRLFLAIVVVLALVRCVRPDVAKSNKSEELPADSTSVTTEEADSMAGKKDVPAEPLPIVNEGAPSRFFRADGSLVKNPIYSVPRFATAFPDSNNVQMEAARYWGVKPVTNRTDAEKRMKELVYAGASPYYDIDNLKSSIPYLVPHAAILLDDIGNAFFDSLQTKGVPLHRFIVTSVLRTKEDVEKLRGRNGNATANSCHLYGTTFDICYNRYTTVSDPAKPARRAVRNDTLKWVLSEVLRDKREQGRCYIKYEVKQGCFHITVR